MCLFPCPAPHLQIEIYDTGHKGEHILSCKGESKHKMHTSCPWYQQQVKFRFWKISNKWRFTSQFQWNCMEVGIFHMHLFALPYFQIHARGSDHLHLKYTLPNLHSDSFLCAHNINKSTDNWANKVHGKGTSCVLGLVLLHQLIRITESENMKSLELEKTPVITKSNLVILTMPTNDAGWLLRWGFFSFGAGDPLAKTWKQPEFPCNKAAVRKAQSN